LSETLFESRHSTFIPLFRTISPSSGVCAAMNAPNCSGVLPAGSPPSRAMSAFISGDASVLTTPSLSFMTIALVELVAGNAGFRDGWQLRHERRAGPGRHREGVELLAPGVRQSLDHAVEEDLHAPGEEVG